jgi:hypothetical protein
VTDDSDADAPRGIEVSRVTIVKTFDNDAEGGAGCWITYSEGLSMIDAVGMISFALIQVKDDYMGQE